MRSSTIASWKKRWSDTPLITFKDRRSAVARNWSVAAFVLLVLLPGCRKPEQDLGLELLPGDPLGVRVESTVIEAFTFVPEPIRTSGLTRNLLGSYLDPDFGLAKAGIVAQLRLGANNVGAGQDNSGLVADSIVLALAFDGINFAYGNLNPQIFRVHELAEPIFIDTAYTTDKVPAFMAQDLSAVRGGRLTPQPFKKPFIGGDSLQPQLRIRLDKALAQRILDAFGTPVLADNTAFLEFFKGLYITPDNGQQQPFQQGILYFNLLSTASKVTIHYRNTLLPDAPALTFDLPINSSSVRYTVVEHDRSRTMTPDLGIALGDSVGAAPFVFVQALGGARAKLRFPQLRDYADQRLVVAKAELVVPVPGSFNPYLLPPNQLFIFRKDTTNGNDVFLPDQTSGAGNVDGNYRPNAKEYRFNITRYVQGVVSGSIPDTGVELVTGSNGVTANRVILAGPAHPSAPMRLDLTFTTY
jgi:hypothetical protein